MYAAIERPSARQEELDAQQQPAPAPKIEPAPAPPHVAVAPLSTAKPGGNNTLIIANISPLLRSLPWYESTLRGCPIFVSWDHGNDCG